MPGKFSAGQAGHLSQRIIVGKAGLVFRNLAELAVAALNDIGHVYDFISFLKTPPAFSPAGGVLPTVWALGGGPGLLSAFFIFDSQLFQGFFLNARYIAPLVL